MADLTPSIRASSTWVFFSKLERMICNQQLCSDARILKGNKSSLNVLANRVQIGSISQRVRPILQILWESYMDLQQFSSSEELKKHLSLVALKNLHYVMKFLAWEVIWEAEGSIPVADTNEIVSNSSNYGFPIGEFMQQINELSTSGNPIKISQLYEECMQFINENLSI